MNASCPCGSGLKYKRCCFSSAPAQSLRMVNWREISLAEEVKHIRACALAGEMHTVTRIPLFLFSTETGAAWMLDLEDRFAARIMSECLPLEVTIDDNVKNFSIAWPGTYSVLGPAFVFTDKSGKVSTFMDFPVRAIKKAERMARQAK